ncbi:MAG: TIGR03936 family radical SAM-associated protein [Hydrogenoanaerobacterium sp.]
MSMENMRDIRVFYSRGGAASYISHLDINRCFQRALARSHLPVWYTQGFNPHIYITFAMPTPLGYKSECESMDMRVTNDISYDEIKERLNNALPPDFNVYKVSEPVNKNEDIVKAEYAVTISVPLKTSAELNTEFEKFLEQEKILVQKKSKKGFNELDIKPCVELLGSRCTSGDDLTLTLRLAAGGTLSINPTLVLEVFAAFANCQQDCPRITKLRVLAQNGGELEEFA